MVATVTINDYRKRLIFLLIDCYRCPQCDSDPALSSNADGGVLRIRVKAYWARAFLVRTEEERRLFIVKFYQVRAFDDFDC